MMTQPKTSNYAETEVTGQLEVLTAMVQQLLRKKEEEGYPRQNNNSRNNNCFRCGEPGHFMRDCMSEKVLATWNPNRKQPNSFNRNNNRTGSWRPRQRESNYVEEDVRYYAHDPNERNVEPVVYRVDMDQGGSAVRTTIRVKGHPVKAIVDSEASVSIITLPIVKQLRLQMSPADGSSIVAVDQAKKKVIGFVRGAPLAIADARVPVDLMVIDTPRAALLVGTDWLRRYSVDLLFSKKRLVFESRGQKLSTLIEYNQPIRSPNHKPEEYEVNTAEWEYDDKSIRKVWSPADQCWHYCIDDIVGQWNLPEPETAIEKALG